jgi:hypothetical protein
LIIKINTIVAFPQAFTPSEEGENWELARLTANAAVYVEVQGEVFTLPRSPSICSASEQQYPGYRMPYRSSANLKYDATILGDVFVSQSYF